MMISSTQKKILPFSQQVVQLQQQQLYHKIRVLSPAVLGFLKWQCLGFHPCCLVLQSLCGKDFLRQKRGEKKLFQVKVCFVINCNKCLQEAQKYNLLTKIKAKSVSPLTSFSLFFQPLTLFSRETLTDEYIRFVACWSTYHRIVIHLTGCLHNTCPETSPWAKIFSQILKGLSMLTL